MFHQHFISNSFGGGKFQIITPNILLYRLTYSDHPIFFKNGPTGRYDSDLFSCQLQRVMVSLHFTLFLAALSYTLSSVQPFKVPAGMPKCLAVALTPCPCARYSNTTRLPAMS